MDDIWIKLNHKITRWEWARHPNVFYMFIHLLLEASPVDRKWQGCDIKRGELIFKASAWSGWYGLSESQIRTALDKLVESGQIERNQRSQKLTTIYIVNYDDFVM